MQVRQIQSAPVETVSTDATLREAVGAMLERGVGSVVVVDAGPVGIVTDTDVLAATYREDCSLSAFAVTDVMSRGLVTTTPKASVTRAIETMERHGVKRLPVRDGLDVVGIVTTTDVARHHPEAVSRIRSRQSNRDDW
ncbi:CBS domain-containing protein [Halogeometricum limi]|uniref:CBS domain-containing protein n=1 Tax=Halogeometricum limi TaxID=555875 RepID=A0A1I6GN73_9EURY|nr:CBS domain-containing protein [Halogeometricum limi]SFR43644.1 CBS domain-containing protein [Halogeometricum limi]